jgi:hypothetical protein
MHDALRTMRETREPWHEVTAYDLSLAAEARAHIDGFSDKPMNQNDAPNQYKPRPNGKGSDHEAGQPIIENPLGEPPHNSKKKR